MSKLAVILFPGTNCEHESKRALEFAGLDAEIVRWNEHERLHHFDGYLLAGGWSYEDRIRAGVISARDPVMLIIKEEAKKGKPVIGICNGAQILVESGMIPNVNSENIEIALAPNRNAGVEGFYCKWTNLKMCCARETAFNIDVDTILPMPFAHAEGRFTCKDKTIIDKLIENDQIMFRYCDSQGDVDESFPVTPNGSMFAIAGLVNKEGNVLAMMPHPERATWKKQLPYYEGRDFEDMEQMAPAAGIFISIKKFLEAKK